MEQLIAGVLRLLDSASLPDNLPHSYSWHSLMRLNPSVYTLRFHSVEDAGIDLCQFLKTVTGVSFCYQ